MPALQPIFIKAYWTLAAVGILWAVFILSLINPTLQRQYVRNYKKRTRRYTDADDSALYAHKIHSGFWHNVTNPEEFGFASQYPFPPNYVFQSRSTV